MKPPPDVEGEGNVAVAAQDVAPPPQRDARPRRRKPPRKPGAWRRVLAVGADVLVPGAGHYALGHTWRALGWFLAVQAVYVGSVALGYEGSRLGFLVVCVFLLLVRGASILVCALARKVSRRPWHRTIGFVAAGFLLLVFQAHYVKANYIEAFRVPGESMYPALPVGSHVLVSKKEQRPNPGDVVAFRARQLGEVYVKRVVGVGGQTVEMRDGVVYLDGSAVPQTPSTEPCAEEPTCRLATEVLGPVRYTVALGLDPGAPTSFAAERVRSDHVFLLGDARDRSLDSRHSLVGQVSTDDIVGEVAFVWWPLGP